MDLNDAVSNTPSRTEVAIAILYQDGKFLMQLRDDLPGIMYPGHWGFFGGHLEPGEAPEVAIKRELVEEIGYCPLTLTLFSSRNYSHTINPGYFTRHIFYATLDVGLPNLTLGEGLDLDLLAPEDIRRGHHYSQKIQQVRPLGPPHQQILLDFMEWIAKNEHWATDVANLVMTEKITVKVNGELQECSPKVVLPDFLQQMGMNPRLVAVEYNGEILHRQFWETTQLQAGDRLEIVTIVGGG